MFYLALAGALFLGWLVAVVFFTPAIPYHGRTRLGLDHPGFLTSLRATCQAPFHERTLVEVFANDEINLAMCDRAVAARLAGDFERDLAESDEITAERWRERPRWEHALDRVVWILERQQ